MVRLRISLVPSAILMMRRVCQISARPTIVQLRLAPDAEWSACGVTLWSPEDGKIYTGDVR